MGGHKKLGEGARKGSASARSLSPLGLLQVKCQEFSLVKTTADYSKDRVRAPHNMDYPRTRWP